MVPSLDSGALVLAFAVTVLEMTEVVALVVALSSEGTSTRDPILGAVTGVAVVAGIAAVTGASLTALPHGLLLGVAAITLILFGFFLLRSTLRTYRRLRSPSYAPHKPSSTLPFAGGFAVGAIETLETVIVLVALAAGGNGFSALVGALVGGGLLVVAAAAVHERVRRIKVPTLKLAATALLFSYGTFWAVEAAGRSWPGPSTLSDLWLVPMVLGLAVVVRGLVWLDARGPRPAGAKG
jgi:uncharacterized membrane protein